MELLTKNDFAYLEEVYQQNENPSNDEIIAYVEYMVEKHVDNTTYEYWYLRELQNKLLNLNEDDWLIIQSRWKENSYAGN